MEVNGSYHKLSERFKTLEKNMPIGQHLHAVVLKGPTDLHRRDETLNDSSFKWILGCCKGC